MPDMLVDKFGDYHRVRVEDDIIYDPTGFKRIGYIKDGQIFDEYEQVMEGVSLTYWESNDEKEEPKVEEIDTKQQPNYNGYFTHFFDSGMYDGNWRDGKREGFGTMNYNDGREYVGYWIQDEFYGLGKITYRNGCYYLGEWKDGCRHGKGVAEDENGTVTFGIWEEGVLKNSFFETKNMKHYNKELMIYSESMYYGNAQFGNKHGYGIYVWNDGEYYEGNWENDNKHGVGRYAWSDGSFYEGQWKNNERNGKGVFVNADKTFTIGVWENNELKQRLYSGYSAKANNYEFIVYNYEGVYFGERNDGQREGFGVFVWNNGNYYIGDWKKDAMTNPSQIKDQSGREK